MSGIYIPDVPLSSRGYILFFEDGREGFLYDADRFTAKVIKPIRVPDHGQLVDADAMKKSVNQQIDFLRLFGGEFEEIANVLGEGIMKEIDNAPTIIPADHFGEAIKMVEEDGHES